MRETTGVDGGELTNRVCGSDATKAPKDSYLPPSSSAFFCDAFESNCTHFHLPYEEGGV